MNAKDMLIELAGLDDDTMEGLSVAIGQKPGFMRNALERKHRTDVVADALDRMGYDLVARSREDGFELQIDPKL